MYKIFAALFTTMIISALLVPIVRKFAIKVGAVDNPNKRRINSKPMPTLGGLAIFIAFNITNFFFLRSQYPQKQMIVLFLAECIIILTGFIDDIYELKPKQKLLGIIIAALIVYYVAGIKMTTISIPFGGLFHLKWLSMPVTIIWIVAITNAINLLDGLDGLATGVSIIAVTTSALTSFFFLNNTGVFVSVLMLTLVAAMIGFLPYNFNPASIFLGDTGSLFIGFMISVFALYGLKNATFISLIIPIIILGVPITDTVYAILRRMLNKKPIFQADKHHLHHRLMQMGLTHRQTVLVIYGIALIFSFISLLFPLSNFWGSVALIIATLIGLELFVEAIGLVGSNRQPLLHLIKRMVLSSSDTKGLYEREVKRKNKDKK